MVSLNCLLPRWWSTSQQRSKSHSQGTTQPVDSCRRHSALPSLGFELAFQASNIISENDTQIGTSIEPCGEIEITTEIAKPTRENTCPFLNLPGEVRNLIYAFTFSTSFSPDSLPNTHLLPSGAALAQTCRQLYHEVHNLADAQILVYGLHTMRVRFFQQLPPERLMLMKALILPDSRMGDSWIKYHDWRTGTYQCVIDRLCSSKFHPTVLIFCTDCRRSQMVWNVDNENRDSHFANALKDLRFALSVLHTIKTVYVVDVGAPFFLATRDLFAELFEKFFPRDEEWVQRITAGFTGFLYHGTLDGSEKWAVQRLDRNFLYDPICGVHDDLTIKKQQANLQAIQALAPHIDVSYDSIPDFLLTRTHPSLPSTTVAVHVFANWPDFCKAYNGPYRPPVKSFFPTMDGIATKYQTRQPSWHLGQDV